MEPNKGSDGKRNHVAPEEYAGHVEHVCSILEENVQRGQRMYYYM